jgi:mono/diheme cytochrome c family protein
MIKLGFCWLFMTIFIISCSDTPYMQGKRLYEAKCSNCHISDGSGLKDLVPSLIGSKTLGNAQQMSCIIANGLKDTIWGTDSTFLIKEMPAFKQLSPTELANIINYINHKWSPNFKESYIVDIENHVKGCQ